MDDATLDSPTPGNAVRVGRPRGAIEPVLASHRALRHGHFTFVRFVLEGTPLRQAWQRCLAYGGGVDDVRHIDRRLREICAQIEQGAQARGAAYLSATALDEIARRRLAVATATAHREAAASGLPHGTIEGDANSAGDVPVMHTVPPLDAWIEARCNELGIDTDFQSQADWLMEYQAEFGEQLLCGAALASATPATSLAVAAIAASAPALRALPVGALHDRDANEAGDAPSVHDQVNALNRLATLLAVPPALNNAIASWLSGSIVARLRVVGVVTLANLADFIDVHGFRWHVRVEGLGAVRAGRLTAWLTPILEELGRPLRETSQRSARQLSLARGRRLAAMDPWRLERFGIVPLERLAAPPELSGRDGMFRVRGPNTFGVDDDLSAVRCWLRRYEASPRTYRSYLHGAEIFVLWALWARRKPMSSLVEGDLHDFRAFLAAPPRDWIEPRAVDRADDAWRPLRGPLSAASQRHVFSVVGSLYSGLMQAGYLSVHAAAGVASRLKLPRSVINIRRRFSDAMWTHLQGVLAELPDTPSTRRLRLVLELGATTGLRLSEMCTARMGMLREEAVPSEGAGEPDQKVWFLTVIGKGAKARDVLLFDDVKRLVDLHQVDLDAVGRKVDPRAPLRSLAPAIAAAEALPVVPDTFGVERSLSTAVIVEDDRDLRPLIGALRAPLPRWKTDANGVMHLDADVPPGDAHGALDPSALSQSLKRLFARAAAAEAPVDEKGPPVFNREAFTRATTHWLRHFFGSTAAHDGVSLTVLRDQLGHASVATTSVYVHSEQKAIATQMAKLRRRR